MTTPTLPGRNIDTGRPMSRYAVGTRVVVLHETGIVETGAVESWGPNNPRPTVAFDDGTLLAVPAFRLFPEADMAEAVKARTDLPALRLLFEAMPPASARSLFGLAVALRVEGLAAVAVDNLPGLDLSEPCFVCGRPIGEGDEPGQTYMDNGLPVPNCSEACATAFYAEVDA